MAQRLEQPASAIVITGFMGTGKSVVGQLVAEMLGLEWVDTDELVERGAGVAISVIFEREGEERFRELESQALREALGTTGRVVSTGGGIMLREENRALMQAAGPIICLTASPDVILKRTSSAQTRPLLRCADPREAIRNLMSAREESYAEADYHLDTSSLTVQQVAEQVVDMMRDDPGARYHADTPLAIDVRVPGSEYRITVGRGLLERAGELCPPSAAGVRGVVVSCEPVAELYGERVLEGLRGAGWEVALVTVPDGEASKALETYGRVCEEMASAGVDRGGCVFALGGGVIGDLAGFAAATYMRGIDLVHLPTTLLAQVDSSIGGKTAVDLSAGKNLVGAFHQPRAVITDVATLTSLPAAEFRSGLGEAIKHACCFDEDLFEFMLERRADILSMEPALLEYRVARNGQIKAGIVEQDPQEKGVRAVLNYGHTVGHALERAAGEWELRHGEVVAAGIVAEARIAEWMGLGDAETTRRQTDLLTAYGLPTRVEGVDMQRAVEALRRDKKIVAGKLRVPLVPSIGSFEIVEDVPLEIVERALRSVADEA
jgi:3-dehydroquinate synthase